MAHTPPTPRPGAAAPKAFTPYVPASQSMAEFTAKDVAELRKAIGVGMMDCKKALTDADGNMEEAK